MSRRAPDAASSFLKTAHPQLREFMLRTCHRLTHHQAGTRATVPPLSLEHACDAQLWLCKRKEWNQKYKSDCTWNKPQAAGRTHHKLLVSDAGTYADAGTIAKRHALFCWRETEPGVEPGAARRPSCFGAENHRSDVRIPMFEAPGAIWSS